MLLLAPGCGAGSPRSATQAGSQEGLKSEHRAPTDQVWSLGNEETTWRKEPPPSAPRGALAVASLPNALVAAALHVIAGGPKPGLSVSDVNETFYF